MPTFLFADTSYESTLPELVATAARKLSLQKNSISTDVIILDFSGAGKVIGYFKDEDWKTIREDQVDFWKEAQEDQTLSGLTLYNTGKDTPGRAVKILWRARDLGESEKNSVLAQRILANVVRLAEKSHTYVLIYTDTLDKEYNARLPGGRFDACMEQSAYLAGHANLIVLPPLYKTSSTSLVRGVDLVDKATIPPAKTYFVSYGQKYDMKQRNDQVDPAQAKSVSRSWDSTSLQDFMKVMYYLGNLSPNRTPDTKLSTGEIKEMLEAENERFASDRQRWRTETVLGVTVPPTFVVVSIAVTLLTSIAYPLVFALSAGAAIGVGFMAIKAYGRRKRSASKPKLQAPRLDEYRQAWDTLQEKYRETLKEYLEYEFDPLKGLEHPAMTDPTNPLMQSFWQAMNQVEVLEVTPNYAENPLATPYGKALEKAISAFRVARDDARRISKSMWSSEEKARAKNASQMLALAMDENASPAERRTAHERAIKELEGIYALPQKAEQRVIALIESGTSDS